MLQFSDFLSFLPIPCLTLRVTCSTSPHLPPHPLSDTPKHCFIQRLRLGSGRKQMELWVDIRTLPSERQAFLCSLFLHVECIQALLKGESRKTFLSASASKPITGEGCVVISKSLSNVCLHLSYSPSVQRDGTVTTVKVLWEIGW